MPAFSSPIDCTPWVIGGLWPAELSTMTGETATVAEYLKADLQRIASSANNELKVIKRAGMADVARQAEESRVIDDARAHAVRRVESTIRHLHRMQAEVRPQRRKRSPGQFDEPADAKTQVMPAVTAVEPDVDEPTGVVPSPQESTDDEPDALPARHRALVDDDAAGAVMPEPEAPEATACPVAAQHAVADDDEPEASEGRHRAPSDVGAAGAAVTPELEAPEPTVEAESDSQRLERLLAFVVRQEPGLNWAVGDHADGTTVLVTDLAHGWIPPGITLPAGVRLLEPDRRTGNVSALLGETTRGATYNPGDPVGRSADFAAAGRSVQARELPAVEDLGWELGRATHWRDGLPRLVHTLAKAATAGTGVVAEEAELLRVHLDTARYQLLTQYPNVEPALLLNCLLLAATESSVAGDLTSANYHLAWFQKLDEPPASQWTTMT
jgi:hypothetical protein